MRLLIILLVVTSCSKTKDTAIKTQNDSTINRDKEVSVKIREQMFRLRDLRDTTLNGIDLKFTELSDKDYNSLKGRIKETDFPLQFILDPASQTDSCLLVKLENGKTDSLCNTRQGDYFEEYTFKGLWKENGLVLVSYSDWEGGNDFFINLKDGGHYNLTHHYAVSPDLKHILSYVDLNETVFIPSALMLTECDNRTISTRLYIEFEGIIITNLSWLTHDQCLISVGTLDKDKFSVSDLRNLKLSLSYND